MFVNIANALLAILTHTDSVCKPELACTTCVHVCRAGTRWSIAVHCLCSVLCARSTKYSTLQIQTKAIIKGLAKSSLIKLVFVLNVFMVDSVDMTLPNAMVKYSH